MPHSGVNFGVYHARGVARGIPSRTQSLRDSSVLSSEPVSGWWIRLRVKPALGEKNHGWKKETRELATPGHDKIRAPVPSPIILTSMILTPNSPFAPANAEIRAPVPLRPANTAIGAPVLLRRSMFDVGRSMFVFLSLPSPFALDSGTRHGTVRLCTSTKSIH